MYALKSILQRLSCADRLDDSQLILFELEQCRQDDRDALNRIFQVIIAGVAALTFIFAAYTGSLNEDGTESAIAQPVTFLIMCIGSAEAALSYLATIGISSSLRYQYMRELIASLQKLNPDPPLQWVEVSAPIVTLNPWHVRSAYAAVNFLSTAAAVVSAAVVGIAAIIVFGHGAEILLVILALLVYAPFLSLFLVASYLACAKSEKMYKLAKKEACKRRANNPATGTSKNIIKALVYYLYPRPQDILKVSFIVLGLAIGAVLSGKFDTVIIRGVIVLLVIDVLVYQSRYQWNDMRGVDEDRDNSRAEERGRLPVNTFGKRSALFASLISSLYKIALAAVIIAMNWEAMGPPLLVCSIAVYAIAACYEHARAKNRTRTVIALVGLGYPLRILSGIWAMQPDFFNPGNSLPITASVTLLLIGSYCFGLVFVSLTWALESYDRSQQGLGQNKPHVELMGGQIGLHYDTTYPLKSRGNVTAFWNLFMLASIAFAIGAIAVLSIPIPLLAVFALGNLGVFAYAALSSELCFEHVACSALFLGYLESVICIAPQMATGAISAPLSLALLTCVAALSYLLIYAWFRTTNYDEMAKALENLSLSIKEAQGRILELALGAPIAEQLLQRPEENSK